MTTPKRILIIEDDESIRAVLDMALSDEGYEVIEAENGAQGLALARTTQPHVILPDPRMPVMDGWAFAQEYQRDEGRQAALIVFTAATNAAQRAAEVGGGLRGGGGLGRAVVAASVRACTACSGRGRGCEYHARLARRHLSLVLRSSASSRWSSSRWSAPLAVGSGARAPIVGGALF